MDKERGVFWKVLGVLSVVMFVISLVVFYLSFTSFFNSITGRATSTGEANLTVETVVYINFTTDYIDWGTGQVDVGETYAILNTADGTVTDGNWTAVSGGLVVENIGNVNVSLTIETLSDAAGFIGGTNPAYEFNISNFEADSCVNSTYDAPTSSSYFEKFSDADSFYLGGLQVCNYFNYLKSSNELEIDVNLSVPYDSLTGSLSAVVEATATAV